MAVFFSGLSIKMMDDFLDRELDRLQNKETLAQRLENAALPYALILLMIGVVLNPSLAGSLFLASYIVGMGKDIFLFLPSRLPSYGEMLIGFFLGLLLFGFYQIATSITVILVIQFMDDFKDYFLEKEINTANLVQRLGKVEAILISLILFLVSLTLAWQKLILVLAVTPIIICCLEKPQLGKESQRMLSALLIFLGLTTFLLGYTIGRKCGKIEGMKKGILFSPIQLRQESLEKGRCPICGTISQEKVFLS